jgi:uncharacterized GH25 family protein
VRIRVSLACLVACLLAVPAAAHEYWLSASRYSPAPGAAVEVRAWAGTGFRGEAKPWSPNRVERFLARTRRDLELSRAAQPGDFVWTRFAPSDPGGAVIAYQSTFAEIELGADAFDAYLEQEGLDGPLRARRAMRERMPGRERYRRCPKLWLAGADAARATRPVGLPLEIVPLAIPGAGSDLRVRVLWQGRPLAGALIKSWRNPLGPDGATLDAATRDSVASAWHARTDARGEALVPVAHSGEWLIAAVHMVPCRELKVADWESTWASLTFERAAVRP